MIYAERERERERREREERERERERERKKEREENANQGQCRGKSYVARIRRRNTINKIKNDMLHSSIFTKEITVIQTIYSSYRIHIERYTGK